MTSLQYLSASSYTTTHICFCLLPTAHHNSSAVWCQSQRDLFFIFFYISGKPRESCINALLTPQSSLVTLLQFSLFLKATGFFICIYSSNMHTIWIRNPLGCCLHKIISHRKENYFRLDCFSGISSCICYLYFGMQNCHHLVLLITGSRLMQSPRLCWLR